jgi:hypothetical protein
MLGLGEEATAEGGTANEEWELRRTGVAFLTKESSKWEERENSFVQKRLLCRIMRPACFTGVRACTHLPPPLTPHTSGTSQVFGVPHQPSSNLSLPQITPGFCIGAASGGSPSVLRRDGRHGRYALWAAGYA